MIPPKEIWNLDTNHLGKQVLVYDRLESTNTLALSLAEDPSKNGLVILAREQTAGRGQYGRTWQAPSGSSVLLTVLVFPPPVLYRPVVLTAWAAVCVCRTVHKITGCTARIKWPNDVLVEGKKICGILVEQRAPSSGKVAAALGIGLNVGQPQEWFEGAGLKEATSLACLGSAMEPKGVACQLIECLDHEYGLLIDGRCEALETRWAEYLALGEEVSAEFYDGRMLRGQLLDLSFDGVVLRVDGEEHVFTPEAIRQITCTGSPHRP